MVVTSQKLEHGKIWHESKFHYRKYVKNNYLFSTAKSFAN